MTFPFTPAELSLGQTAYEQHQAHLQPDRRWHLPWVDLSPGLKAVWCAVARAVVAKAGKDLSS